MTWRPLRITPSSAPVEEAVAGIRFETGSAVSGYLELAWAAAAADRLQARLDPTKPRVAARILPLDQGLQGFAKQVRFFLQAGKLAGLRQQFVVDRHGCTHAQHPTAPEWNTYYTSMTADN